MKRAWDGVKKLWNRLRGHSPAPPKPPQNPLSGIVYTDKVKAQIQHRNDPFHSFPREVENYAIHAQVSKIQGNDGVERTLVQLHGIYHGYEGYFEWIIEPDGRTCNHRYFRPVRKLP